MALFTLVRPRNVSPARVGTVMSFPKHLSGLLHSNFPLANVLRCESAVDQNVCPSIEVVFMPLITTTGLPRSTAYVTELGAAPTSADS
jgi:hypothetical protein